MTTNQIASILNVATGEVLGSAAIQTIDLSNVVDIGKQLADLVDQDLTNIITSSLDAIGRRIFVNRVYQGRAPKVLRDAWEYGSIVMKMSTPLPEAEDNQSWQLNDGESYDPNIYTAPVVITKLFNQQDAFQVKMPSITRVQLLSAFDSETQLNAFLSMLETAVANAITVRLDWLISMLLASGAGEAIHADYNDAALSSKSGVRAVNLLYLYNQEYAPAENLTAEKALTDPIFLRFTSRVIHGYIRQMSAMSTKFNVGNQPRFTPRDLMHVVMLGTYVDAFNSVAQSDTFHEELTELPLYEEVPFWQGTGTGNSFADLSSINVKLPEISSPVNASGVVCMIFDRDAVAVCQERRRVTTNWNPVGEFWNYWHKLESRYLYDGNENFVVFFIA